MTRDSMILGLIAGVLLFAVGIVVTFTDVGVWGALFTAPGGLLAGVFSSKLWLTRGQR